jgi:2-polyprenyl-3-methyl-5-hydroxy-6-metoxy-1,4-benzoquinol methylase
LISKKKIQKFWLNSFQPYAHGTWTNGNQTIGDEEALAGRNELILSQFEKIILKNFSLDEIKKMNILDIGSYDGHTSVQIEKRLPFKEIVSVEPRRKNFLKGKFVRDYLKIKTNVKFINSNLEDIKEKFDIVFCVGVLHHLDNINDFLKQVCNLSEKSIFIDCLSYDTKKNFLNFFLEKLNKKIIEPKDIIYKFKKKKVGVSGHKLETNYYDGSTLDDVSVVTIPDNEFIKQVLFVNGFKSDVLVSGKKYFEYIKSSFRDFSATIIYGEKEQKNSSTKLIKKYIKTYEKNYLENYLDIKLLTFIDKYKFFYKFILIFLDKNKFNYEIFLNLKYNFNDKINFERAKNYLNKKKVFKATRILYSIISKYNSDYRTCYRSFALLALIYKEKNDKKKLFLDLLKNCNEKYPEKIIEEIKLIK